MSTNIWSMYTNEEIKNMIDNLKKDINRQKENIKYSNSAIAVLISEYRRRKAEKV